MAGKQTLCWAKLEAYVLVEEARAEFCLVRPKSCFFAHEAGAMRSVWLTTPKTYVLSNRD